MLLRLIGTQLAKYLTEERIYKDHYFRISIDDIKSTLEPGDVVLVEGQSQVSNAIQFITSSNWSHASIFIGEVGSLSHCLIEVKAVDGCIFTDIDVYMHHNLRICRPVFLNNKKRKILIDYLIKKIGSKYDLKNIIDLIRYIFPTPPVPKKLRRHLIGIGAGDPTKAICSTLIAEAFKEIGHPILPLKNERETIVLRHPTYCLPKDFDISPFFQIIKPPPQKFH